MLELFDYEWPDGEGLRTFIFDCQLDDGGFQMEPIGSTPDGRSLNATYFGIRTLETLAG